MKLKQINIKQIKMKLNLIWKPKRKEKENNLLKREQKVLLK